MMTLIMRGKNAAEAMQNDLLLKYEALKQKNIEPSLAIIRVGKRPDDLAYERGIVKKFSSLGISVMTYEYDDKISQKDFDSAFTSINDDPGNHGILLFRPLPKNLSDDYACKIINPLKDIDCMSKNNIAGVFAGDEKSFAPCTPSAVMAMLRHYDIDLAGKNVVIIGRSMVVGRPLAMLMLRENATVTICHTKTHNLSEICRNADVICACAGKAKMITQEFVSEKSIIVDVGINVDENGKICGDVDYEGVKDIVRAVSPVPGGVGAVTTSILAENIIKAAELLN